MRYSDYEDSEPDETNELSIGAALVGAFLAKVVVPLSDLFRRRRNPRRPRWLSVWGSHVAAGFFLAIFMLAAIVLTGAQP